MVSVVLIFLSGVVFTLAFITITVEVDIHLLKMPSFKYSKKHPFRLYSKVCAWELLFAVAGFLMAYSILK